ncbi:MAG: potassium transporter Kup [Gemmatimonadaceae bacterium]
MSATPAPPGEGDPASLRAMSVTTTSEIPASPPRHHADADPHGRRLAILTLTALGVVYGDIGTSPLYALRECFKPEYGLARTADNVYGVLSLILWSLIAVVSFKYIIYIMRADNRGEGGILALLALVLQQSRDDVEHRKRYALIVSLGLFGAALLYGDGIITPAISVLSAVEGLGVANAALDPRVIIVATVIILLALFLAQRQGTAKVGTVFGPLMLVWFLAIAILGSIEIAHEPRILFAVNPIYGVRFFIAHGTHAFILLGAVVLAVTGAEALYADMGHFGKKPIRRAWFGLVFPALLLNYFGQGGLLLRVPEAAENPFYLLAPRWLLFPLIAIATMAAIIASQALISGAFSLTQQSVQLGYTPRVTIVHTSKSEAGQIYIPEVNNALMLGTLLVVLGFKNSSALGAAYGIAVTGTMAITTILFYVVARERWHWSALHAGVLAVMFLTVDLAFFGANVIKVEQGGWVPLAVGAGLFTVMTTWKRGRLLLREVLLDRSLEVEALMDSLGQGKVVRVPGTAIFMTSESEKTPVVLLHRLKHNKVLHEQVILLSIIGREVPEVSQSERLTIEKLGNGFWRVKAYYGFMETPNVEELRHRCQDGGIKTRRMDTTYYLGREQLIAKGSAGMKRWRKKLFAVMARNARSATEFFGIPPNRVVELGAQIEF